MNIVIEALDGAGKETQSKLLKEYLESKGNKVKLLSFPMYNNESSYLVKKYLNGEIFEDLNNSNLYACSLFYVIDRYLSYLDDWKKDIDNYDYIIYDRYSTSNFIHQCVKDEENYEQICDWLYDLEFNKLKLPEPDIVFFLDVPPEVSKKMRINRKNKINNSDKQDIHESNDEYLKKCYNISQKIYKKYGWYKIDCVENGNLKTINDIHRIITDIIDDIERRYLEIKEIMERSGLNEI